MNSDLVHPWNPVSFHVTQSGPIGENPSSVVNMVDPFVFPRGFLTSQNLKKFRKTVSWVSLGHCLQRNNNRFITCGIRVGNGKPFCYRKYLNRVFTFIQLR